jgi:hypothetical protein
VTVATEYRNQTSPADARRTHAEEVLTKIPMDSWSVPISRIRSEVERCTQDLRDLVTAADSVLRQAPDEAMAARLRARVERANVHLNVRNPTGKEHLMRHMRNLAASILAIDTVLRLTD